MSLIKRKQIDAIFSAPIRINNFTGSTGSNTVTTQITSVLNTAGRGSVSVPLQVSSGEEVVGVITTGANNRVEIWANATKDKIKDSSGEEVYGRLTESGGVYTLTYYSLNTTTGAETAYTLSSTAIDFEFNYRYDFNRLPADFATALTSRNVQQDPASSGATLFAELLTITALNTINDLTKTPSSTTSIEFIVNGLSEDTFANSGFSVTGKAITVNATNLRYNVETTDRIVARYLTLE